MNLSPSARVFLCIQPADFRKGIEGMCGLIRKEMQEEPLSGDLYVFHNRRGNLLRIVYWDKNGYAIWAKRLERGRFSVPEWTTGEKIDLPPRVLQMLIGGVAIRWKNGFS